MYFSKGIFLLGITIALCTPAMAVTKCVKLTPSTTCTTYSGNGSNWSATCGSIEIQGVAFCGSQKGGSVGTKSETVTTSLTSNDNRYCWCKMVSPAVSSWVFSSGGGSASGCANGCASTCAYDAARIASFRSALFSGLGD